MLTPETVPMVHVNVDFDFTHHWTDSQRLMKSTLFLLCPMPDIPSNHIPRKSNKFNPPPHTYTYLSTQTFSDLGILRVVDLDFHNPLDLIHFLVHFREQICGLTSAGDGCISLVRLLFAASFIN